MDLLKISVVVFSLFSGVFGYGSGPPPGACVDMFPGGHGPSAQSSASPYSIVASANSYTANDQITVTIQSAGDNIKGFLLEARRADPSLDIEEPIGKFTSSAPNTKDVGCQNYPQGALSHSARLTTQSVVATWTAPSSAAGHIQFVATVVKEKIVFWTNVKSSVVNDPTAPAITTADPSVTSAPLPAIDVSQCGSTKGCVRFPENCVESSCKYLVTWKQNTGDSSLVDIEMSATLETGQKYFAMGLSADTEMGDDSVIECVYDDGSTKTKVCTSTNAASGKANARVTCSPSEISNAMGEYSNGKIKCSFTRQKSGNNIKPLDQAYYILMARGDASGGNLIRHGLNHEERPIASNAKADFTKTEDIQGKAPAPALVKVHGILMIISWMLTSSVAIIFARYYKPMWPNNSLCGEKVWFANHRGLQLTTLLFTIIAFVLIFIHAMGYSYPTAPTDPKTAFAHPILGIMVMAFCLANPIMALFRPHPGEDKRIYFNWAHWCVGTLAQTLAIINISFGVNLPDAGVPIWVFWVFIAWIVLYAATSIVLEILQCVNLKRDKARKEEFELQKTSIPANEPEPKQPNPSGHMLKNFILLLYVLATLALTIAVVVGVAAF